MGICIYIYTYICVDIVIRIDVDCEIHIGLHVLSVCPFCGRRAPELAVGHAAPEPVGFAPAEQGQDLRPPLQGSTGAKEAT